MLGLVLILSMFAFLGFGEAATRYVDNSIGDCASTYNPATRACSGGSAQSWDTIAEGISGSSCGDTLEIRSGTFTAAINDFKSCTSTTVFTVKSYQNETVTIRPTTGGANGDAVRFHRSNWVTLSGAGTDNGKHIVVDAVNVSVQAIRLTQDATGGATDVTLTNLDVKNAANNCLGLQNTSIARITIQNSAFSNCGLDDQHHGIYLRGPDHIIRRNVVSDISGHCIHEYNSGGGNHRNLVEYNVVFDCGSWGILIGSGQDNIARYNIVYNAGTTIAGAGGIRIRFATPLRNVAYNNTIYNNTGQCFYIHTDSTNAVVKNNICYQNTTNSVVDNGSSTVSNTTTVNPSFVNAPTDFSLGTGSVAIGSATSTITAAGFSSTITNNLSLVCNGSCDTGAHDSPEFLSCSVEDGDATKVRVLFTTNVGGAMQGSVAGNWAAVVAGAGATENAVTAVPSTRIDITLSAAVTNGQSVTIAYTAGTLTDSLKVGNTRNSSVRSFTAQSCANNVGAPLAVTFVQSAFGFFDFYGTEPTGFAVRGLASGTHITLAPNGCVAVRNRMTCSGGNCPPKAVEARYQRNAGSYTAIPGTTGADAIAYAAAPNMTHGQATTSRLGAGTFVAGTVRTQSSSINNVDLAQNEVTEFVDTICLSNAVAGDTYNFRLYDQAGTALDTYTVTGQVTIGYPAYVMGAP